MLVSWTRVDPCNQPLRSKVHTLFFGVWVPMILREVPEKTPHNKAMMDYHSYGDSVMGNPRLLELTYSPHKWMVGFDDPFPFRKLGLFSGANGQTCCSGGVGFWSGKRSGPGVPLTPTRPSRIPWHCSWSCAAVLRSGKGWEVRHPCKSWRNRN